MSSLSPSRQNILFLVPYPLGIAPSQRFRFEQYFGALDAAGYSYEVKPFLDNRAMIYLYEPGNFLRKVWKVNLGLLKRFLQLFSLGKYDYVFIHREAAAIGPPIYEWLISKFFGVKVIFDFDDAIWLHNTSSSNSVISFFKRYQNADNTSSWAYKVSCGNQYLADHAAKFNTSVVVNPTTIDTLNHHNQIKTFDHNKLVIGWTGTHSTIKYLEELMPLLVELEKTYDFELLVIADQKPEFNLKSLRYKQWNKKSEIDDLLEMDVGIMPLKNDKWASGKCGFKALQYMALGIPAIVSPVGVNTRIVNHLKNGWICNSQEEWKEALVEIIQNKAKLKELSEAARIKIEEHYSVKSNTANFLNLFA